MAIRLLRTFKVSRRTALVECASFRRVISTDSTDHQSKYTEKLRQRAEEQGLTVSQLLEKVKADEGKRRKEEAEKLRAASAVLQQSLPTASQTSTSSSKAEQANAKAIINERKDAPPFKALSSILNIPRILSTPHTPEQIGALWTAYHASRSNGTGRGYVCASIPLDMFQKMAKTGRQYPTFVLPLPRIQPEDPAAPAANSEENLAHEFYFMQWDFHAPPGVPSASDDLFAKPMQTPSESPNPASATVLFTPLQEYKLRGAFATPYIVLTLYTDLATTHGVVLLRGEITPSTSGGGVDRYMLSQADAQILALSLQKFYLWNDSKGEGERLLRSFHEKPEEFKWQDLLNFSSLTIE